MYEIRPPVFFSIWLLPYYRRGCCADCSNVVHDPPSYWKISCDFLYLDYTQSTTLSSLLLNSFLGSSLFFIIIFTVHFLFHLEESSVFFFHFSSHGFVFSFPFCHLFLHLDESFAFICSVSCAAMRLSAFAWWWLMIDDGWLWHWWHTLLMILIAWSTDILTTERRPSQTYSTTEDDRSAKCSFNAVNFQKLFNFLLQWIDQWRTVFMEDVSVQCSTMSLCRRLLVRPKLKLHADNTNLLSDGYVAS